MSAYHILIVDDAPKARRQLRTLLEQLGLELQVRAVPSGEEALLELRSTHFDLVLTDYSLPGINGFELLKKAKKQLSGLKVVLILGDKDTLIRNGQEVIDADAYLSEPVDPADFLDVVERCLGIVDSVTTYRDGPDNKILVLPGENIAERLTRLRQSLAAKTSLLLDHTGAVLACAGDLPDETLDGLFMQPVIDSFSDGMKVSRLLKAVSPFTFQYFSGTSHDLILSQVGDRSALLVILDPINLPHELNDVIQTISEGVDDLHRILLMLGLDPVHGDERVAVETDQEDFVDEAELIAETPKIEALFQEQESNAPKTEELEAFWDSIAEEETTNDVGKADMLTYEQALQLGLAPEEENGE